jgi:hypothetical protein
MAGSFLDTSALAKHYLDLQSRGLVDQLVSSDKHLLSVARAEGSLVLDPENP